MEEINNCCKRISDGFIALENKMETMIKHESSLQAEVTRSSDQVKELLQEMHTNLKSAFSTLRNK
ncbi:hypothetical protein DPMN_112036 [Dreissena polymorpha]|uniref:Uncharacterized protein n=1 Tax=Dreissena polymorpha TaxID=45954 RepID=A0A9D4KEX2_DREPO|nr:hypothetical protein DPMN_112036 [Dreissena polymorpha]